MLNYHNEIDKLKVNLTCKLVIKLIILDFEHTMNLAQKQNSVE